ncbi:MAG: LicD family protein, partial [Crenarchaeota archaeon]|nr:LicD family protein [Thermoproteota archaeon]
GQESKQKCLLAYARVCDVKRTLAKNCNWSSQTTGVWIDIFPLDGVPEEKSDFEKKYYKLKKKWKKIQKKRIQFECFSNANGFFKKIKLLLKKILLMNGALGDRMQKDYIKDIQRYSFEKSKFWSQLAVMDNGPVEYFPMDDFSVTLLMDFEKIKFCVMNGYENNLKAIYGDYMKFPPKEERIPHQSYIKFYWRKNEK